MLGRILHVADVLADATPWLAVLTDRILRTDWTVTETCETVLSQLLALPAHLMQRTFSPCFSEYALHDLLWTLPYHLHSDVIAAAAEDGTLAVPHGMDSFFYAYLATAAFPSPGLLALVHEPAKHTIPSTGSDGSLEAEPFSVCVVTAASLGRALSVHPTITHLELPCMSPAAMRAFAACVPCDAMQALARVSVEADRQPAGAIAAATALKKLSHAAVARVSFVRGRRREDDLAVSLGLQALAQAAASPAHMPALSRLTVHDGALVSNAEDGVDASTCYADLLSLISSPELAEVDVKLTAGALSASALIDSISSFRGLQLLSVDLEFCSQLQHMPPASPSPRRASGSFGSAFVAAPELMLREVNVTSARTCPTLPLQIAAAAATAASASLTRLVLHTDRFGTAPHNSNSGEVLAAAEDLWAAAGRCSQLRELAVSLQCVRCYGDLESDREKVQAQGSAMARCLGQLTMLTKLVLQAEADYSVLSPTNQAWFELKEEDLRPALHPHGALRELHLCCGSANVALMDPDALLARIAELPSICVLGLSVHRLPADVVAEFVPDMRSLTGLVVLHHPRGRARDEQQACMNVLRACCPELQIHVRKQDHMYYTE